MGRGILGNNLGVCIALKDLVVQGRSGSIPAAAAVAYPGSCLLGSMSDRLVICGFSVNASRQYARSTNLELLLSPALLPLPGDITFLSPYGERYRGYPGSWRYGTGVCVENGCCCAVDIPSLIQGCIRSSEVPGVCVAFTFDPEETPP